MKIQGQSPLPRTPRQRIRLAGLRLAGRIYGQAAPGPRADEPPRSVLLIRPDHLGDLLFLTPGLHALRQALPAARLTLLVGPWGAEAVRGNQDVDELRLCHFPAFARSAEPAAGLPSWARPLAPYRTLREAAGELKGGGYDAAVVLRFDHWWGAWLAAAAGIPRRIGYDWPETRPFLTDVRPYLRGRHEVEQNAALLQALKPGAVLTPGPLRYVVSEADRAWAAAWLAAHSAPPGAGPWVAIHPGAGAAVKQWPAASWAALADRLIESCAAQVLLTGGSGERELGSAITAAMTQPGPAGDACGQTSLGQLAALYAACRLVIGGDSGPLHLAVAGGAATLQLFGPVDAAAFGPWGDPARQRVIASPYACVPCNRLAWPVSQLALHKCMAAITLERVVETAIAQLKA